MYVVMERVRDEPPSVVCSWRTLRDANEFADVVGSAFASDRRLVCPDGYVHHEASGVSVWVEYE